MRADFLKPMVSYSVLRCTSTDARVFKNGVVVTVEYKIDIDLLNELLTKNNIMT